MWWAFQHQKCFQGHIAQRLQVESGFWFWAYCYFSETISQPLLKSVDTTPMCSQELGDASQFSLKKHPLLSVSLTELQKAAELIQANQTLFHEENINN